MVESKNNTTNTDVKVINSLDELTGVFISSLLK